jgi:energy-coupling factor transport system substrate-specific component
MILFGKTYAKPIFKHPTLAVRDVVILALCTALIFALQVALAGLPNIELVSLLIILYARTFRFKSLYIIYAFVLLEGMFFGFHIWWISYLYIWTILAVAAIMMDHAKSPLAWAVLSGMFGLFFGMLCALPYLVTGGLATALVYWVSGIPFDLIHCVSNAVLYLLLWKPLLKVIVTVHSHLVGNNNVRSNDVHSNDVRSNNVRSNDVHSNDVRSNDVRSNDVRSSNVHSSNDNDTIRS